MKFHIVNNSKKQESKLDQLIKITEWAALDGCSKSEIRRRIYAKEVGTIRKGKLILIPESEIEKWRQRHFVPAATQTKQEV
jgi:excisionase family DNA binding protein